MKYKLFFLAEGGIYNKRNPPVDYRENAFNTLHGGPDI